MKWIAWSANGLFIFSSLLMVEHPAFGWGASLAANALYGIYAGRRRDWPLWSLSAVLGGLSTYNLMRSL